MPAIKALLLADAAVAELVAGRVYPDVMPARATLPGLTLVMTTWPIGAIQTSEGQSGLEAHRLQLDAYATSREGADGLMEAASGALCPKDAPPAPRIFGGIEIQAVRETPSGGAPTYEHETNLYRRSLDFKVHAARAA